MLNIRSKDLGANASFEEMAESMAVCYKWKLITLSIITAELILISAFVTYWMNVKKSLFKKKSQSGMICNSTESEKQKSDVGSQISCKELKASDLAMSGDVDRTVSVANQTIEEDGNHNVNNSMYVKEKLVGTKSNLKHIEDRKEISRNAENDLNTFTRNNTFIISAKSKKKSANDINPFTNKYGRPATIQHFRTNNTQKSTMIYARPQQQIPEHVNKSSTHSSIQQKYAEKAKSAISISQSATKKTISGPSKMIRRETGNCCEAKNFRSDTCTENRPFLRHKLFPKQEKCNSVAEKERLYFSSATDKKIIPEFKFPSPWKNVKQYDWKEEENRSNLIDSDRKIYVNHSGSGIVAHADTKIPVSIIRYQLLAKHNQLHNDFSSDASV